jgi:hypothetical protein
MKRLTRALAVTFALVILASATYVIPPKSATASTPLPVTVTNTPLPVSGNVNASIFGTPSVSVSNFPSTQPVSFSNTSTSTLFVDTDGPARQAVSGHCGANFTGSGGATCTLVSVPSGKILVIDTISAAVTPLAGKAVNDVACDVPVTDINDSSTTNRFHIGVPLEGSDGTNDWYLSTIRVAIYAAGGKNVSCFANTTSDTGGSMAFNFAGHLVTP